MLMHTDISLKFAQEMQNNGYKGPFSFTTHLLPVAVGIYSTCVCSLKWDDVTFEMEILNLYDERYANSGEFVRMRKTPPNLISVEGTQLCDINVSE